MVPSIPGVTSEEVLKVITAPSLEPYWKNRYKGSCQDIFFITTLDRTYDFIKTMNTAAEASGYPVSDIGVYLQPRFQGVNCHCEFNLPYDPDVDEEVSGVRELFIRSSESLLNQGAFFTRPYGIWADLAYQKDKHSAALLKKIKGIFDPNGVMNPGKLYF